VNNEHVIVVDLDLGYGDAGKGSIVDWLCARSTRDSVRSRPVQAVARFNGGAQAGTARAAWASAKPPAGIADVYRAVAERVTLAGDGHLKRLLTQGPVVFEGAQGVLLDEWHGFHPYTTWSTTTFANAEHHGCPGPAA